jgi:hypothetical protein
MTTDQIIANFEKIAESLNAMDGLCTSLTTTIDESNLKIEALQHRANLFDEKALNLEEQVLSLKREVRYILTGDDSDTGSGTDADNG